jgi:hypothetical protein
MAKWRQNEGWRRRETSLLYTWKRGRPSPFVQTPRWTILSATVRYFGGPCCREYSKTLRIRPGMNWFFLHWCMLHWSSCEFMRKSSHGERRWSYYQRSYLCKVGLNKIALRGGYRNCRWSGGRCNLSVSSVYKRDYWHMRWRKIVG